jgi:hypothetical protein
MRRGKTLYWVTKTIGMIKKILLFLLVILIVIQFIRPEENHSMGLSATDITWHYTVPDSVLTILKRSCYDCHSNNTVYPWYNHIQPVAWWLANHIKGGKWGLNFSEFGSYTAKKQAHKLKNISEEIKVDGMPLDSYLWIHKNAILRPEEKALVTRWADSLQAAIISRNHLPADLPGEESK